MKSMKYITAILLSIGLAVGLNSCIADMEEYNPSGSTADNVFSTEEGHTGLVNLCYSQLRKEFYGRENPIGLAMVGTDIWTDAPGKLEYFPTGMYNSKLNSTNTGLMKNCWERFYIAINNCNAAVERAPQATYGNETTRAQRVGEARFLRAFYYWHVVEQWGGVALKMDETKSLVNTAQRSSVRDFYEKCILPDLEYAAGVLPVMQADHGRATKASAQGMLARMYLTWASYLKYFEQNDAEAQTYYQKALSAADSIIAGRTTVASALVADGKYNAALYGNVNEIFAQGNNKNNKEALFIVSHSTQDALNPQAAPNRLTSYFISSYADKGMGVNKNQLYGYADMVFIAPTKYFLNLYDASKDARYAAFFREVWRRNDPTTANWTTAAIKLFGKDTTRFLAGPDVPERLRTKWGFGVGDTALYFTKNVVPNKATVRYGVRDINDLYETDGTLKTPTNDYFYPQLMKYRDTVYATATTKNNAGKLDVIMMRFAEMYLIAAEAAFALGDNAGGLAYVNVLRGRAQVQGGASNLAVAADINGSPAGSGYVNFILDERARELCGEHLRWFDLKRTKQLENRLGAGKANPNITQFDPNKHYVRPLPISFLQSINNGSEFGQNSNYD